MTGELITVIRTCRWCKQEYSKDFPLEGVQLYESGSLLQHAFPGLPPGEREQFKTGIHPECWTEMFCTGESECMSHSPGPCPPPTLMNKYAKEAG